MYQDNKKKKDTVCTVGIVYLCIVVLHVYNRRISNPFYMEFKNNSVSRKYAMNANLRLSHIEYYVQRMYR